MVCGCEYYDILGSQLFDNDLFFAVNAKAARPLWKISGDVPDASCINIRLFRRLAIDYIHGEGVVKYVDRDDCRFSDNVGPCFYVWHIVAAASLRPLITILRNFQIATSGWIQSLRQQEHLASFLTLTGLRRLSR